MKSESDLMQSLRRFCENGTDVIVKRRNGESSDGIIIYVCDEFIKLDPPPGWEGEPKQIDICDIESALEWKGRGRIRGTTRG